MENIKMIAIDIDGTLVNSKAGDIASQASD